MYLFKNENLLRGLLGVLGLLSLGACHDYDEPYPYYDPEVVVSQVRFYDATLTRPAGMILDLENIGIGHAYDVEGFVDLYVGNRILESAPFSVGVIYEGQIKQVTVEFARIDSHSDYGSYGFDFGWYDANQYSYHN